MLVTSDKIKKLIIIKKMKSDDMKNINFPKS